MDKAMKKVSRENLKIRSGMTNHAAKAIIAAAAQKDHETIYRFARTVGEPEVNAVENASKSSSWLKSGTTHRAPEQVTFNIDASEFWGFYLKGFGALQAVLAYDPTDGRSEVAFFLHGEPDA